MSLLFNESPFLGYGSLIAIGIGYYIESNLVIAAAVVLLIFLLYFYRYEPFVTGPIGDCVLLVPCEGKVLDILDRYDYYYIPIFLSPMNRHTQIYPANCTVLERKYDHTGEFNMVMNLSKSQNNEKKIHTLCMGNGTVIQMTQIAGFLPRMITSSEELTTYKAGDYFGMIKFGSRVDLLLPKYAPDSTQLDLHIKKGECVTIGQLLGQYK